jgi:hypothetical protein
MKLRLTLAALAVAAAATAVPAFAGTKDLVSICASARLSSTDKKECRAQFKAAQTDADRTAVFKTFDNKMNGFAADGSRLGKDEATQAAEAK